MTGQLTINFRLVRCPRCRGILREYANIPVYECAGCGTVLQAKKRKNDIKDAGLHIHETEAAQKNELEHVSDDKEDRSLSQEETLASIGELPLDKNYGSDQNEIEDSIREQSGEIKFSSELSSELTSHANEESSPAVGAETDVDQDERSLEQNNGGEKIEYRYCNEKQPGGLSFSDEFVSSTELNYHGSEESSNLAGAHRKVDFEQNSGRYQIEYGHCNEKHPGEVSFSDEVASSTELTHHESDESSLLAGVHSEVDENTNCLEQNNGRNQSEFGDYQMECPGNIKFSNEVSSSTEFTCQEIEESSPMVGTSTEVDENFKSRFIFGSSSVENLLAVSLRDSIIPPQWPLGESISSDNHMSPYCEQLEQSQRRAPNDFDRASSMDILENIALANPSSEFSVALRDMPKSPTTRSYYGYDDSVSSYDGTDDQIPDLHLHLSRRKFEVESASTKAMPRRDDVMNNVTCSYPEMQDQAWNCSSISLEKKHYAMRGNKGGQDELLESTRDGHPVRSRMKFEKDEHLSRLPFYSRDCQVVHEKGSPSNYGWNEFQYGKSFHSPNKPEYPEKEKMELLKMVYELQDQLTRTHISEGKANGRFPRVAGMEKQNPSYYGRAEVELSNDFNNAIYDGRCNQGRSWPHRSQISRIPLSAEAIISRHQVDRSCSHCCPQDWKCAAPLPPHICCNRSQYTAHQNQRSYNPYSCSPSSPQHFKGSEFPLQSCDVKSDDHCNTNHNIVKKFSRERDHLVKRYVRPVAGGAPFLVCYGCSALLKLPADFLLFRRKCHQLKCSACSVILKFTLQYGTHVVPYTDFTPDPIAPPPSEIDACSAADNRRKLASVSHVNNCSHADTVSDDYGPSLCKSCSTEGEPVSVNLPFQALKRDSNDRNMSSGSSSEPMEERKKQPIFKESENEYKIPVKTLASSGPSSNTSKAEKFSSEIEELPRVLGSPLHRLMGYSSPREVMDS